MKMYNSVMIKSKKVDRMKIKKIADLLNTATFPSQVAHYSIYQVPELNIPPVIPKGQKWFWHKDWLSKEHEVNTEIVVGQYITLVDINPYFPRLGFTRNFQFMLGRVPVTYKVLQQITRIEKTPVDPSIGTKPIQGTEIWYCTIERNSYWIYRLTFQINGEMLLFRNVGFHEFK